MNSKVDYSDVVRLLQRVPLPPEGEVTRGADDEQVAAIAGEYGRPLPADYVQWLRLCNGSVAGPGGLYGVRTTKDWLDALSVLRRNPQWVGSGWIPIAGDGNGNVYVLDSSGRYLDSGAVYFVDSMGDGELTYIVASSLVLFLKFLLEKEVGESRWPFDSGYVLSVDPDIGRVRDMLPRY